MDRGDESVMDLMMISLEHIREQFPSLQICSDVLLDNAGGSQVPRLVAAKLRSAVQDANLTAHEKRADTMFADRRKDSAYRAAD